MGVIKRFRQWLGKVIAGADKEIVSAIGKPEPMPEIEPIWKIRKRVREEAIALWREERVPKWKKDMDEAIEQHREEGMKEDELIERYGEENV